MVQQVLANLTLWEKPSSSVGNGAGRSVGTELLS